MAHELSPARSARRLRLRACLLPVVAAALVVVLVACYPKKSAPPPTGTVYLTFDDGPSAYTPEILSVLEAAGARATFFVLGENATQYPNYVRQADAVGDVIGDHTWDHRDLTTLSPAQIRWELEVTADKIADLTGKRPTLWRPPWGRFNATVTQIASSLGLSMRLWDVDPKDASNPGTGAIINTVLANVRDGDIVLLHDGGGDRSQTVAALPTIIDRLQDRGYQLATL